MSKPLSTNRFYLKSGVDMSVPFLDSNLELITDPTKFRYDVANGYLALGDADDVGIPPYGPLTIDRSYDSGLGAMVTLNNRAAGGVADIWFLSDGSYSHGVIFGMGDTGTALPAHFKGALSIMLDTTLVIGDLTRAYAIFEAALIQLAVPVVKSRVSDAAIVANTFVKLSSTAGRVTPWIATDDPYLIIGVALDAAGGSGIAVRVVELRGQSVQVKTDGVTAITAGDRVILSTSLDGRISGYIDDAVVCGIAESSDAGGTPNALVTIHF